MLAPAPPLLPLVLDRVPPGLRLALGQEGVPFVERRAGRIDGRFVLFDSRGPAPQGLVTGQQAIDVDGCRDGWRGDPLEDLLDERSGRLGWRIGGFQVSEEVARVDKRATRRHVMERLRAMLERRGGVWFRIGAYPFPYQSAFNFRFDHDEFDAGDFDAVLGAIAGYEQATSHYVCASTHESQTEALARLRGLDVGSHGYLHHTYQDSEENSRNIRRGIETLRRRGIEPSGFVAPHGRFNLALLSAMESLAITHSSEFGLAHDELPFFPVGSNVLQIPIHPICLGIFLEALANRNRDARAVADDSQVARSKARLWFDQVAGGDSTIRRLSLLEAQHGVLTRDQEQTVGDAAIESAVDALCVHFAALVRAKYHAGEPIFLYGHPNGRVGRHPRVLTAALEAVGNLSAVWLTNMTEFDRWWRSRASVRARVVAADGGYCVLVDHRPRGYRIAGEYWRGEHVATVPLDESMVALAPESLAFQARRAPAPQQVFRIDPPQGLRSAVRNYLDWEKVTPVEEIGVTTWRGWMKRTLRRIKD
ncbi:MAG: hypothetical protein K1X71_06420 [Pirellulales bacterium]|nr:hypothetical protein [Pirellulales bacterium]